MEILQHLNPHSKPSQKINQQLTICQPRIIIKPPKQQVNHEADRQEQIKNPFERRGKNT